MRHGIGRRAWDRMRHGIGRRGEDEGDREERHGIGRRGEDEAWDREEGRGWGMG